MEPDTLKKGDFGRKRTNTPGFVVFEMLIFNSRFVSYIVK